jgi:hypothetical protein
MLVDWEARLAKSSSAQDIGRTSCGKKDGNSTIGFDTVEAIVDQSGDIGLGQKVVNNSSQPAPR